MRLMLLGGGNALGQALIRLGAEEDIGFLAPRPPAQGWDAASLTQLLDDNRPDVVINLAYYYDWFQSGQANEAALTAQEHAVDRLAELCQHHDFVLLQPSSYRVFDGARTTAYSEKDEVAPLDARGRALWRIEQSVRSLCPRHVLLRFGWLLDDSRDGVLGRVLQRLEQSEPILLADDRRGNPTHRLMMLRGSFWRCSSSLIAWHLCGAPITTAAMRRPLLCWLLRHYSVRQANTAMWPRPT